MEILCCVLVAELFLTLCDSSYGLQPLKDELPRLVGAPYATGEEWRNSSRKNEEMEPKQKWRPVVDVSCCKSKFQYCKEQYCIGNQNVRSMNQGKLEVIKQMARVNTDILFFS